jgi:hypothetical protein
MSQSVWNGSRWRRVSDIEARFRRGQGQEVRVDAPPAPPAAPQPVSKLADLPKPRLCSRCGEPGHTSRSCKAFDVSEVLDADAPVPTGAAVLDVLVRPVITDSPADLTEAELERLTAPGGEG